LLIPPINRFLSLGLCLLFALGSRAQAQNLPHYLRDYRAAGADTMMRVTAFADGSLQDAIQGGTEPSGSGRVGLQLGLHDWVVQGDIAFASTLGEVGEQYGLSVLSPSAGAGAPTAMIQAALPNLFGPQNSKHYGVSGYLSLAQSKWVRSSSAPEDLLPTSAIANVVGGGGALFHSITGALGENAIGLTFGVGPTVRVIFGESTPELRTALLQRDDKMYWGGEGFFAVTVNGVTASTQFYAIRRGKGRPAVKGLTGLNAIFAVALRANIFKLDMRRDNATAHPPKANQEQK